MAVMPEKNTGLWVSLILLYGLRIRGNDDLPSKPFSVRVLAVMQALETLIYVSTAAEKLRKSDVVHIIRASEALNKRDGVSGVLLYSDQRFMQCIEGTVAGVQDTYWRIVNSTAHHGIVEVFNGTVNARRFASWEWAFRSAHTQRFSSPATKRFLDKQDTGNMPFVEQSILSAFWGDSEGTRHLWAA